MRAKKRGKNNDLNSIFLPGRGFKFSHGDSDVPGGCSERAAQECFLGSLRFLALFSFFDLFYRRLMDDGATFT